MFLDNVFFYFLLFLRKLTDSNTDFRSQIIKFLQVHSAASSPHDYLDWPPDLLEASKCLKTNPEFWYHYSGIKLQDSNTDFRSQIFKFFQVHSASSSPYDCLDWPPDLLEASKCPKMNPEFWYRYSGIKLQDSNTDFRSQIFNFFQVHSSSIIPY